MIPEIEQEATDFDWFAADERGFIGHFTTAGFKLLPKSVSESAVALKKVTNYFKQLTPTGIGYHVSGDLDKQTGPFESEGKRAQYLSSFSEMAARGLYSFDIDTYVRPGLAYFLVAAPVQPVRLDSVPMDVRAIVERTRLKGIRLGETSLIDYELTLNLYSGPHNSDQAIS